MALSETYVARPRAVRARTPITVRALVEWTYAVQQAHRGGESAPGAASISQTGLVFERLSLGCTVDVSRGGSRLWGALHCDEDALTVHGIVEGLRAGPRELLIHHGQTRGAPDWRPPIVPLRCGPVIGSRGEPKGIYRKKGKEPIGYELRYEGDWPDRKTAEGYRDHWPAHFAEWAKRLGLDRARDVWPCEWTSRRCAEDVIAHARIVYAAWVDALEALRASLECNMLLRHKLVGLGAILEPWRK